METLAYSHRCFVSSGMLAEPFFHTIWRQSLETLGMIEKGGKIALGDKHTEVGHLMIGFLLSSLQFRCKMKSNGSRAAKAIPKRLKCLKFLPSRPAAACFVIV